MLSSVKRVLPCAIFSRMNSLIPASNASIWLSALTMVTSCADVGCESASTNAAAPAKAPGMPRSIRVLFMCPPILFVLPPKTVRLRGSASGGDAGKSNMLAGLRCVSLRSRHPTAALQICQSRIARARRPSARLRAHPPLHPQPAQIGEDHPCRIVSRCARDAAARMRAGGAVIEAGERPAIIGMSQHRPGGEELVEGERAMKDVAAGEPELALEVERGKTLRRDHAGAEAGRVALDRVEHQLGHLVAAVVPRAAVGQGGGDVLAKEARHMRAGRRQAVVECRRNHHLD